MSQRIWATPIKQRFTLTSYKGPIKIYKETGEVMDANNSTFTFGDGTLQFSDSNNVVKVHALRQSKAVILIEIGDTMIAAFNLSPDRGLLVKHLTERGGCIPRQYRDIAIAILVLPAHESFAGYISADQLGTNTSGPVYVKNLLNPRIFVPEPLLIMYQHLRNAEHVGLLPRNKHTFEQFERTHRMKNIGNACRVFTAAEAMQWLEKSMNRTTVETKLQEKFVFGKSERCVITYPKQLTEYVRGMCRVLNFIERPQFDEEEELSSSDCSSSDNSQDSSKQNNGSKRAVTMTMVRDN